MGTLWDVVVAMVAGVRHVRQQKCTRPPESTRQQPGVDRKQQFLPPPGALALRDVVQVT